MNEKIPEILRQIETVVVGKNEIVEKILMAILAGGHVLMEDVPGVGKTTTAMTFAKVLGLDTKRVQFTSDTVPSDIIGYSVYDKESGSFVYKPGAVMTNLLLADEINRTSSKTQSALLEAMEELHVTVDGKTYELPQPFVVLATQNPVGSAGTQMLPPSQMDRFMIKISMGYPDFESQISILRDRHTENPPNRVTPVVDREQLQALIQEAAKAEIQDAVYEYVTRLTQASREHPMVQLGVSPAARWRCAVWRRLMLTSMAGTSSSRRMWPPCSRMWLPPSGADHQGKNDGGAAGDGHCRHSGFRKNAGD